MSNIKMGRSTHRRVATNFPTKPAQQRINEHLEPFRDKIENALAIDSVEAIVLKRVRAGRPCVCIQHHVTLEDTSIGGSFQGHVHNDIETPAMRPASGSNKGISFDIGDDDIFGEANYQRTTTPKEIEMGDIPTSHRDLAEKPVYNDEVFIDTDFVGDSAQCGICYNEGVIPAFEAVNHSYNILSVHDIVEVSGYHFNQNELPGTFDRQITDGFVSFEVVVPKYFIEAKFSVRNNTEVYSGEKTLYDINNKRLTLSYLNANRGKRVIIRVMNVDRFTHAILLFKLIDFEIRANLSTENEVINYENEVTIGDMNVIMSSRSGSVRSEDFLIIPERNLVLKINGAPRKSTANKSIWQWTLGARAVQRSEPTARIFKHYKIY